MSNLTFDHGLLKEHAPQPLEGHAVVVFERVGEAGEKLHSVLLPGARPVAPRFRLSLRKRTKYFAYAVDLAAERHLDFSESVRLADEGSEFRLIFHLAYAVYDASRLARSRNQDPLRRVRSYVRSTVMREIEQMEHVEVWKAFPSHARKVVDDCIDELRAFAGGYGLGFGSLRLAVRLPEATEWSAARIAQAQVDIAERQVEMELRKLREERRIAPELEKVIRAREQARESLELTEAVDALDRADFTMLMRLHRLFPLQDVVHSSSGVLTAPFQIEPQHRKNVFLGATAPHEAQPGNTFLVQFAAYTARFRKRVRDVLQREAEPEEVRMDAKPNCQWPVGARLGVRCRANGLLVATPVQHFVWDGQWHTVSFDVEVPRDTPITQTVLVLEVDIHDALGKVCVASLSMEVQVTPGPTRESARRWVHGRAARKAFASYASQDRAEVLGRVSSIAQSTGMEIFVDCTHLRMGEEWELALLEHILDSDRFLLFWSEFAAQSTWVRRETEEAVDAHGASVVELHPLRHTPVDSLPDYLRKLHADDIYLQVRDADAARASALWARTGESAVD